MVIIFGGIAGIDTSGTANVNTVTITNCYYLKGTCDQGINKEEDITGKTESKEDTEMKTEDFAKTLNNGYSEQEQVWKYDPNANDGYPILN